MLNGKTQTKSTRGCIHASYQYLVTTRPHLRHQGNTCVQKVRYLHRAQQHINTDHLVPRRSAWIRWASGTALPTKAWLNSQQQEVLIHRFLNSKAGGGAGLFAMTIRESSRLHLRQKGSSERDLRRCPICGSRLGIDDTLRESKILNQDVSTHQATGQCVYVSVERKDGSCVA